ncbi:oligopeptide ABC transporter substrate-binding protein [Dolosicoccus paucivorans]|uniref:Oligopeptide ABC transporter substrate-binding protein n=1 Tax=Dolosicoccus paucivorans TaxID=84521 RepID=A0A2N6SLM4_9LACT|nr:oligopeptide ABC transporter substrate-binding protein [Dolosicoccus paucivorans]PMB84278.1 oligopeptide ABC transporter substrate-binding protein [Dolosicoccus paucivorans]PMC57962.1 oligopeptide ABC transporter substrate-binding protein [Dolosicoccus paucivorans]
MNLTLKKSVALFGSMLMLSSAALSAAAPFAQAEGEMPNIELAVSREGDAIEGGEFRYALVGDPFSGILNPMYWSGKPDGTLVDFFSESLYGYDENFLIDDSGFAKVEFHDDEKAVTITIPQDVKWPDGEPVTIDDVIAPYEIVGHPEYTGIRYGKGYVDVKGMEAYKKGDADTIEGLERVDDYTLKVHYENYNNSIRQAGGAIASVIQPAHIVKDIDIETFEDSDFVRKNPMGLGPFKVESITPGEAITFVPNENYWRGDVTVDKLIVEVVNPTAVVQELKAGNYDVATLPADQYETFKDATNFDVVGNVDNAYNYVGFKLGTADEETGEAKPDESKVTWNKALRQAMAHAIDFDAVGEKFYQGLRFRAESPIIPLFGDLHKAQDGNVYDEELANKILDDAGFKDVDGDGFREDPNGEAFTLQFAAMAGSEVAEPETQYYMEQWKNIGINVELVDGRLLEFNAFYDRLEEDDPAFDVYLAAWGTGGDPNPHTFYGRDGSMNYTRWATEENDKLLEAIGSSDAFDEDFRVKAYGDWQDYMNEEMPIIPTLYRYTLTGVNKRVSNWDTQIGSNLNWTEIKLLDDAPAKE